MDMLSIEWPDQVLLREVGPRDGLQAETTMVPVGERIALIDGLTAAGLRRIEAASFVSPKWLPQMAEAEAVMAGIKRSPGVIYSVLVPNVTGAERAVATHPDEMTIFVSASETHNRHNVNRSIACSLREFREVTNLANRAGIPVSAVIVTAFGCPYEGEVSPMKVEGIAQQLLNIGITDIALGDTVAVANPRQVYGLVTRLRRVLPDVHWGLHFHDTRATALANALAALAAGAVQFDTALGGIGGSPFSPGAGGNLATEDVVYCFESMGVPTNVSLGHLIELGDRLARMIGHTLPSRVHQARGRMVPVGSTS